MCVCMVVCHCASMLLCGGLTTCQDCTTPLTQLLEMGISTHPHTGPWKNKWIKIIHYSATPLLNAALRNCLYGPHQNNNEGSRCSLKYSFGHSGVQCRTSVLWNIPDCTTLPVQQRVIPLRMWSGCATKNASNRKPHNYKLWNDKNCL